MRSLSPYATNKLGRALLAIVWKDCASFGFICSMSGAATLAKTGAGTLLLTGNNSYSGGTSVNGGILAITNDNNLGASGTTVTLDGGTLQFANDLRHLRLHLKSRRLETQSARDFDDCVQGREELLVGDFHR